MTRNRAVRLFRIPNLATRRTRLLLKDTLVPIFTMGLVLVLVSAPQVCPAASAGAGGLNGITPGSSPTSHPSLSSQNPAALYAEELGYEYKLIKTDLGEKGVVVLPNGEEVDAWDFYRGVTGQQYSYCARIGKQVATRELGDGSFTAECAVCQEADGTEIGSVMDLMGLSSTLDSGDLILPSTPETQTPPERSGGSSLLDLPSYFDWRDQGGLPSVKNQGGCGSCWAFATVGPLECNIMLKDGVEVDLSEQWLVSCNRDGWGCGGGWWAHDYHEWKTDDCGGTGAVLEQYFPYTATDAPCNCPYPHDYFIQDWDYVSTDSQVAPTDLIKQAILDYGPVSVAVAANSSFSSYSGGVYDACDGSNINHGVVLVGWDDSQGANGVWFLRNSWGPGWGENGYMRIQYNCNFVGYAAAWVQYQNPLRIILPDGVPSTIDPMQPTTITVRIDESGDSYVPGTAKLHYRYDGGAYNTVDLTQVFGNLFRATLPPATCDDEPEFYFSAEGVTSGEVYNPTGAPGVTYSAMVGQLVVLFSDDCEADRGWTVEDGPDLTDGTWDRGVPVGGGDRGDPPTDCDGSGCAWLTDNTDGNSDVDGGRTWLISQAFDLTGLSDVQVGYGLWYTNNTGSAPDQDLFKVYLSDNDGTDWVLAETIGPVTQAGWTMHSIKVDDFVSLTSQVRVRFEAADLDPGSVVEAGIDEFSISQRQCAVVDVPSGPATPVSLRLYRSQPNPFASQTQIRYDLPSSGAVRLVVYDASGRMVRTLVDADGVTAGPHSVLWDGRDDHGRVVPSGVYSYRLDAGGQELHQKMVRLE